MERESSQPSKQDPLSRIPEKSASDIRYVTFNVNGIKTLFHYHPWNQLHGSVDEFLRALGGDIVSLQELKTQPDAMPLLATTKNYRAFISLPKAKKGYSGVALYVRLPQTGDSAHVRHALTVIRAEEGITGRLKDSLKQTAYCDLPTHDAIGGYPSEEELDQLGMSLDDLLDLDSQGRAVVLQLADNTVVFSLYCPANSMNSSEGALFRHRFLHILLQRCTALKNIGRKVVVMGDINVSPDLIDNAECINEFIRKKLAQNNLKDGGDAFERVNEAACLEFRDSAPHRALLNKYVIPSFERAPRLASQFLFDSTRIIQKRKLALYTVWNTMTNSRQSNYGSRIDLILVSSEEVVKRIAKAGILPFLFGSDHCPVYMDLVLLKNNDSYTDHPKKLSFEAKTFYKLGKHRDISSLFAAANNKKTSEDKFDIPLSKKPKLSTPNSSTTQTRSVYSSRKPSIIKAQRPISNFFFQRSNESPPDSNNNFTVSRLKQTENGNSVNSNVVAKFASLIYDDPPKCHHKEECALKTSTQKTSKGKKFWCCARTSKGSSSELGDHRCDYFEWAKRPGA